MNTVLSSLLLWASGVSLVFFGAAQMQIQAASESDGSSSLIAENIRSRGAQSFGLGIGFIGLGCMHIKKKDDDLKGDSGEVE